MNPKPSQEITMETLLALRKENDAVRLITERLRVKEMGPADHIRTKHEVKAFVESGSEKEAISILAHTAKRIKVAKTEAIQVSRTLRNDL